MFDKLTKDMCPAAHIYWIIALVTIVFKGISRLGGVFSRNLGGLIMDVVVIMWDLFWVYIVTSGIKKLCDDGYEIFGYAASAFFLILWFRDGMNPPVRLTVS